jgi:uncharacterized protein
MALTPMTTTFKPDASAGGYGINAYGPGFIQVNGVQHTTSLILSPESGPSPWGDVTVATLGAEHLQQLLDHRPELVLIGTGERQVFLPPAVLAPLTNLRIGVECMSLPAACRTYNILMGEDRRVLAALLFK